MFGVILAAARPDPLLEGIGALTVIAALVISGFWLLSKLLAWWSPAQKAPPKLLGTEIPELGEGLDLAKRYDIIYSGEFNAQFVERLNAVLIVGYIGNDGDEYSAKLYMRGRWLALESVDGRRHYVIPRAILSLQESESGA